MHNYCIEYLGLKGHWFTIHVISSVIIYNSQGNCHQKHNSYLLYFFFSVIGMMTPLLQSLGIPSPFHTSAKSGGKISATSSG